MTMIEKFFKISLQYTRVCKHPIKPYSRDKYTPFGFMFHAIFLILSIITSVILVMSYVFQVVDDIFLLQCNEADVCINVYNHKKQV